MISLNIGHSHNFKYIRREERPETKYWGRSVKIEMCHCGEMRETPGGGYCHASPEAWALLKRERPDLYANYGDSSLGNLGMRAGSGWYFELPAVLSLILDQQGEAAARAELQRAIDAHSSSVLTAPYMGY